MSSRIALLLLLCGCHSDAAHSAPDLATPAGDAAEAPPDLTTFDLALSPSDDLEGVVAHDDLGSPGDLAGSCVIATSGESGECRSTADCPAGSQSTPGYCPGPADIQCCALIPNPLDNPPTPAGWTPMTDPEVTPDMTTWAVMILHDPADYPMFSTATMMFGALLVLARVEWHPADFQNHVVHRGVTLYKPTP